MNILIISSIYPEPESYQLPANTKVVHYYAKKWQEEGHRVLVMHPYLNPLGAMKRRLRHPCYRIKDSLVEGVRVLFGEMQGWIPHRYDGMVCQQRLLARRMKGYLAEKIPDFRADRVIVDFPMTCLHFCRDFCKAEMAACTFHGVDVRMLEKMQGEKRKNAVHLLQHCFSRINFRSGPLLERCRRLGAAREDSQVCYLGIDEALVADEAALEEKISRGTGKPVQIIFAGNLNRQKRVDHILSALSRITVPLRLTIAGDGPEMEALREMAQRLPEDQEVVFAGRLPRQQVSAMMHQSDIFVMISTNETFGLVYLEAMAQGCIAVGARGEGIDGVIRDGENGFLVDPQDEEALANTLMKAAALHAQDREAILRNGYATAKAMTDGRMAMDYLRKSGA